MLFIVLESIIVLLLTLLKITVVTFVGLKSQRLFLKIARYMQTCVSKIFVNIEKYNEKIFLGKGC